MRGVGNDLVLKILKILKIISHGFKMRMSARGK